MPRRRSRRYTVWINERVVGEDLNAVRTIGRVRQYLTPRSRAEDRIDWEHGSTVLVREERSDHVALKLRLNMYGVWEATVARDAPIDLADAFHSRWLPDKHRFRSLYGRSRVPYMDAPLTRNYEEGEVLVCQLKPGCTRIAKSWIDNIPACGWCRVRARRQKAGVLPDRKMEA